MCEIKSNHLLVVSDDRLKEQEISKQDLISATKEMAQAQENMLSGVREPCTAPSPDAEIKCIHVFKTIKTGCDSHPVKYPEQEQYQSACKEAEQYLSLHRNDLAGDIGDINTDLGARKQFIDELAALLRS